MTAIRSLTNKQSILEKEKQKQQRLSMSNQRKQRKQNYIDGHVQGALLRRICFHWIAFFVVAAASIVLLQALLGDPSLSIVQRMQNEVAEFTFMGIVMLALFPAFMLDTIRFSNRFVGPIARVRRHLRQLGEGNTERCKFRNNDFWSELAEEYNVVAEKVERLQEENAALKAQAGLTSEV